MDSLAPSFFTMGRDIIGLGIDDSARATKTLLGAKGNASSTERQLVSDNPKMEPSRRRPRAEREAQLERRAFNRKHIRRA